MNLQGRDLKLDLSGEDVRLLQSEITQLGLSVPDLERQQANFGQGTREAVISLQKERGLDPTGVVDAHTVSAINQMVDAITYTVAGTVASPNHAGLSELRVQIVDKNVGQDVLLTETTTDVRRSYRVSFVATSLRERGKRLPDLQARVYAGQEFLAASAIRYNATNLETLDVKLSANSTARLSEYEALTGTLAEHYTGQLGDLKESNGREDLTYLANKTGWDARAVALAALADRFSQSRVDEAKNAAIKPAFYYALFRTGLSADADTLYSTDAQTAEQVWKQAIAQGVIPKTLEQEIPKAVDAFQTLSATHALDARAISGTSTLREMLELSLGHDAQRQQQFADLYTRHRSDLPTFWDAVKQTLGEQTMQRLQLDGQLGYLTLNNAPLIGRLHNAEGQNPLLSTLDLARRGYYRSEQWNSLLDGTIPERIAGSTLDEKRANYARLLAAQVRLSYPTTAVAEMVHRGEVPLAAEAGVRDGVYTFLTEHQDTFSIGMHPIEQYLARNGLGDAVEEPVKQQIKRLQRVYQITPNDQAMSGLLKHNLDSAYQVVRYEEAEFVRRFSQELGGEDTARLTYAKAQHVHNVVLNVATSYLTARQLPALGSAPHALVIDPTPAVPAAAASDVIAYPTLEGLFGSMDYCTCEECRSILSPAAYLVDLLVFLDNPPNDSQNPQSVLLGRRPDIQYLPLTCENTNLPIPSIDLVNETLEYFVTNNLSLANYLGHDTSSDATAEELLANPQFVNDAAYVALKAELFPPPLPFHQPLEAQRLLFDKFKVSLPAVMEALRVDDAIERASDTTYGWRDILMEQLQLSRIEYRLLTDSTLTLQQLYGYAPTTADADVLTGLSNVKAFTRRVGVMYEDIIELLKTKFINPNSVLLPQLERLGVPFTTLKALKDGTITDANFEASLAPGLNPAEYGGDIKKWVRDNYARIMGLITLTLAIPAGTWAASKVYAIGDCVWPSSPPTGSTLYYECTTSGTSAASKPLKWPTIPGNTLSDGTVVWTCRNASFDNLAFRYADPAKLTQNVGAIEFIRLLRFIRLWKKLGLTVEQTDHLITALYPVGDLPGGTDDAADLQKLDAGFLTLLPQLGVAFQVMGRLNLNPDQDLLSLLVCWSPIDVYGAASLYRRMFLSPAQLKQDPAFADDGYGNFLQDNTQMLLAHTETLRAAFSLTDAEFSLIVANLRFGATTPLTLDTISAIYRHGWLARVLELSVQELLLLVRFTGLDPFAMPDPPNPSLLRLLQLVQALGVMSLKPVQVLYLIWNQDISGKSVPGDDEITALARTLRANLLALESSFAGYDDPNVSITRLQRLRQQALATVSTATRTESAFAQVMLDDANVFQGAGGKNQTGLDDLIAIETLGLSAQFFLTNNLQATPDMTVDAVSNLSYAAGGANHLPAGSSGSAIAGIWSGYLEVLQDGLYTITVTTDSTASVVLKIDGAAIAMVQNGTDWSTQNPVQLTTASLNAITLTVTAVKNILTVNWATAGSPTEVIPARYLYSGTLTDHLRSTYIRYLKIASLATGLNLTGNEIAHFAEDPDYKIGDQGWLNALVVSGDPDAITSQSLCNVLIALLDFARIKATLSPDNERLLAVLQNPTATLPNGDSQLLSLTGWNWESLNALLTRFGKNPFDPNHPDGFRADLAGFDTFRRIYDAYANVTAFGISALALFNATINEPSADTVRTFQLALRARYGEAAWLLVLKPINDELRGLQRDALVAYTLQKLKEQPDSSNIDTADKLFEYFLMDVQMDPCMQTSRVRQALSSVQLFTERCLMNLEPRVAPSSINAEQWEWMKRYRTWEANREVFLWPENWLEPELRDDQSPFFKEAMSQLLQSDITEDSAAVVLLDYLSKLEEVAKLEPCGIYYAENDSGVADDIAHVVARTTGAHRKYYYRQNAFGSWTPWEQIQLNIEDNPVLPVVWKGRLLLFWLHILKTTPVSPETLRTGTPQGNTLLTNLTLDTIKTDTKASTLSNNAPVTVQAVLCLSEYYNGKWQPTKTSDINNPLPLGAFPSTGQNAFDRSSLQLLSIEEGEEVLRVYIIHSGVYSSFRLYNTHSLPVPLDDENTRPNIFPSGLNRFWTNEQIKLAFQYQNTHETSAPKVEIGVLQEQDPSTPFTLIEPGNQLQNSWVAPFFFQDSRHAFYVKTDLPPISLAHVADFGIAAKRVKQPLAIPPLEFKQIPTLTRVPGTVVPLSIEPPPSIGGSFPLERSVSEGVTVRINTNATVQYDGSEIGPGGGFFNGSIS